MTVFRQPTAAAGVWLALCGAWSEAGAQRPRAAVDAAVRTGVQELPAQAWRWAGRLPAGLGVEVKGVNGDVRATLATGNDVEVTATKRARRSLPSSVELEVIEHDDGVTICAVYPTPEWDSRRGRVSDPRPNECLPGDQGRMNTQNNDVQVSFLVRLPAGVRLVARTVNGSIEAAGLRSHVDAATVNGAVVISTSGYAQAATVNGDLDVTLGSGEWRDAIDFRTLNGSITLTLPPDLDADVHAQSLTGRVDSDWPLTVTDRVGRKRATGTVGRGGRELFAATMHGNVYLRAAGRGGR